MIYRSSISRVGTCLWLSRHRRCTLCMYDFCLCPHVLRGHGFLGFSYLMIGQLDSERHTPDQGQLHFELFGDYNCYRYHTTQTVLLLLY